MNTKKTKITVWLSLVLAFVLFFDACPVLYINAASTSNTMTVSDAGLELIKSFEGFYSQPYYDYGHWSIGYGSYVCPGDDDPKLIYPNGISQAEADKLLKNKIGTYMNGLNKFLTQYNIAVNQNQYDALLSFTYNLGQNIWTRSASSFTLKKLLIDGNYTADEITEAFYMWRHAGGKELEGLAKRRLREARLFNSDINMSDPASQGYQVANYVVSASYLTVRSEASSSSSSLGSIRRNTVISILYKDSSQKWGFTTYGAFFGWVSISYLVPVKDEKPVTVLSNEYRDDQGLCYTINRTDKTASLGNPSYSTNTSDYNGENGGYVELYEELVIENEVYTLTGIGAGAFSKNKKIKKIYIPASVKSIASDAFKDSSLKEIYYENGSTGQTFAEKSAFTATDIRCSTAHKYGDWNVVIEGDNTQARVEESVCSVCGKKIKRTATGIKITQMPKKLEYIQSQELETDGMIVKLVFDDGHTMDITPDVQIGNIDENSAGKQTVKVNYSIFSTSFKIKINEIAITGLKVVEKPITTTFIEGSDIDLSGLVVYAIYNNDTEAPVTEYNVSGYNKDKVGEQTITVKYNGCSTTFPVTVNAKTLKSISLLAEPDKKEYYCGEEFDPTGIIIRAEYDNGTSDIITDGFTIQNFNSSKDNDSLKVRIYYESYYKTISVSIILNELQSNIYSIIDGIANGVEPFTTVSEFKTAFKASDRIVVCDNNGKQLKNNDIVCAGCTVALWYNADKLDEIGVSFLGDFNSDGQVTLSDYMIMSQKLLDEETVDMSTYDLNGDNQFSLSDIVCLVELMNRQNSQ